ncbi:transporter substrate-binding domain-containing protein [Desulfovibrio sp. JC022]|uniref:transporter substrate-binding domain-containing protein n=1 Tax=Desulfovibrio sp. JC022 TaxID=2593642 RepID=UPI0013D39C0B|nr:transporter substrate-binding domain-containing protein [Desulfovibrio sp. JC022]NDV24953.1 transporter substrate-binding domain-containing protein [Desulfovibrio sp. JC022]
MILNLRNRFLILVMVVAMVLVAFPTTGQANSLIVRGDFNYPPYEYLDNGIPSGFNVDIMQAVAEVMGLQIKINLGPWSEVRRQLEEGKIDALTGMYYSPDRARLVEFSTPHIIVSHAIFVREDSSIRTLEDLAGKKILVQRDDIMHDFASNNCPDTTLVLVESQVDALKLLASGQYDAALLGKLQNLFWVQKEGISNIITVGPPIRPGKYCFATRKGNLKLRDQLNEGLSIIKNSGKYDEIYEKWFGIYEHTSVYREMARYAAWVLTPLVVFLIFFILWTWLLRSQVRKKTAELTAELAERFRAETKFIVSEERYRSIFENIMDGYYRSDMTGKLILVNPSAVRLLGYESADELVGKSIATNFFTNSAQYKEFVKSIIREERISIFQTVLHCKNGDSIQAEGNARLIRDIATGEPTGVEGVFRDVTERQRSEDELRRLRNYLSNVIDSMPSQLIGVNAKGLVTQWNHAAQKASGVPLDKALGRSLAQVAPLLSTEMKRAFEAMRKRKVQSAPQVARQQNGETLYEDITVYPLVINGTEGAVIRIDDVTERVRLEHMMIQSEKMMSVGGLAAGMAHEINNPLAAIIGYAQNITKRIFGDLKKNEAAAKDCDVSLEKIREYLKIRDIPRMLDGIHESGNRAATIVSNMLNFSRKSEKNFGVHDLAKLLDNTLELVASDYDLKKQYDFRKIEIVREYAPDVPVVYCESNEMQQVFLNLLKNGAEAMSEKTYSEEVPQFSLRVRKEEDMAIVEVEDNGPGMDETVRKRILEPFFTTKAIGKGTGLGLSVSYFIVTDQHRGSMEVHSFPGFGTRFIIKLPIAG